MNQTQYHQICNESDWFRFGEEILKQFPACRIYLLFGELGSGKTTLVKALCRLLGVTDIVQSPTFSIVNEYRTETGERVVHMDLYRAKSFAELHDIGIEEYLYSGDYCFIEWPELLKEHITEKHISVYIEHADNNTRTVKLFIYE